MPYTLPPLPYDFGALEPYIDAKTMEIHHDKHHAGYVEKLNAAVEKYPELQKKSVEELLMSLDSIPDAIRTAVRNQGGGHANHSMFWLMMKKNGGGNPQGKVAQAIDKAFGSFAAMQETFNANAKAVFGSGWSWLSVGHNGQLVLSSTPNQDSPLSQGMQPVLGLDVWEHAYYLKYQNKRPDYVSAWWHVINWEQVEENYRAVVE
jgi:Fe-Mn family superoxide dismutase